MELHKKLKRVPRLYGFSVFVRFGKQACLAMKNRKPRLLRQSGLFVIAAGFEPATVCLEGRCSIQLSYATDGLQIYG